MIGQKLAHYEIVAKIGSGGMGEVYRARDTKLDRDVALKVLPQAMARDPERRKRFEREAKAVAALKHPNIVTIHSVEEQGHTLFITMELVEGKNLAEITPNDGLSLGQFFDIAIPLSDAIATAHDVGITHRDLKPANILLDHAGRVKVLDFGLAKLFQADPDRDKTVAKDSDTQPGMVLGTVSYMSPEQAEGKKVDHRSDIFSLGIVFYEMATGQKPFKGDTSLSIMSSILRDTPASVTDIKRTLPNQLGRILEHCLVKDPSRRFQSATDVRNELEALKKEVTSDTAHHKAASLPRRRWPVKRLGALGAGAVVVVLAVLFGANLFKGGPGRPPEVPPAEAANSLAIFPFENLKDPADPERIGQIMQELLITDLSGLGDVKVYSSQRLEDVQSQIAGSATDDRTTMEMAGAVAARAGAKTMLTGTLSQLGDKWILTCQIVDVDKGTIVRSKRIDGSDLYTMVDQLTREFHADLSAGEPDEVASKIPIAQKTSSSLEAYRHYLEGIDYLDNAQFDNAIKELEAAIKIDPKFGQAYYKLGIAKWWHSNVAGVGKQELEYILSNGLYASEKEKRMTEAMIPLVSMQWSEGLPIAEQLTKNYPDEKEAWYALGEALYHFPGGTRQLESLDAFQRAVALDPDFELPYRHILDVLGSEKRFNDAGRLIDERIKKDPENLTWYQYRAGFVIYTGTETEAEEAVALALAHCKTAEDKSRLYSHVADGWDGLGNLDKAEFYRRKVLQGLVTPDTERDLFWTLFSQNKFDEAETLVRGELDREPDREDSIDRLLSIYEVKGWYREGREYVEKVLKKHPTPGFYNDYVRFAIWEGNEATIAKSIDRASKQATTKDDRRRLFSSLAWAYSDVGELSEAEKYFGQARNVDPSIRDPFAYVSVGWLNYSRGRYSEAEEWFRRALAEDPKNTDALIGMAVVSIERGDLAAAKMHTDKAIEVISVRYVAPYLRAVMHIFEGKLVEAERDVQEALRDRTSESGRWDHLVSDGISVGWTYLRTGHSEKALETFKLASGYEFAKRNDDAHVGLGWTYFARGDYVAAERSFNDGLSVGYGHTAILVGLAHVKAAQGDLAAAEKYARRAMTEGRRNAERVRMLGWVRAQQGAFDDALTMARKTVAADSTRESLELLAWAQVAGDIDVPAGIETAKTALAIPRSVVFNIDKYLTLPAPAEHTLGLAYLKQGDPTKAVEYLEKAVAYQPKRESAKRDLERAREMASRHP
jgi:tetratricopeptide (TPR) repeat protein/tRNA A-37 threonylcarbamoyl transferase component Bud32